MLTLLEGSKPLHSDMVLLAIGVTPDTHLAKDAGLSLGIRGSIAVNERMETSVPDIYAVGDAVEVTHFVTGQKALISLAGPANKQGRIAADNICGGNSRFRSYLACRLLTQYGFTCSHLSGGYSFYQVVTQERQTAQSAYPCGMEKL